MRDPCLSCEIGLAGPALTAVSFLRWRLSTLVAVSLRGMLCKWCNLHNQIPKSGELCWVKVPSTNYRVDAISKHEKSKTHAVAADLEVRRLEAEANGGIKAAQAKQITLAGEAFLSNLRIMYWLLKRELPHTTNFPDLLDLAKRLGCSYLDNVKAGSYSYRSERTMQEMVLALGEVVEGMQLSAVRKSGYWSVLMDETTDISICKQLILYAKYLDDEAKSHVTYLGTVELSNGRAATIVDAVEAFCKDKNLPLAGHLAGVGSDGANVMGGVNGGVSTLLKQKFSSFAVGVHCLAHREALAVKQAADDIPAVKRFNRTLFNLFTYYENSAVRSAGLKLVQETMKHPKLKLKQPKAVRWLSHDAACDTLKKVLASVVIHLDQEAAANNDPQAIGLLRLTQNWEFVAVLHLMLDTLPQLSSLSKFFQKASLDFCGVQDQIQATLDVLDARLTLPGTYSKRLKQDLDVLIDAKLDFKYTQDQLDNFKQKVHDKYLLALSDQLKRRFPENNILAAFEVFNPKNAKERAVDVDFGQEELEVLVNQYEELVDGGRLQLEFPGVMALLGRQSWDLQTALEKLATTFQEAYPETAKVAKMGLLIPMSTADCERGFSCLKRIKTPLRNRLSERVLGALMMVSIEGPQEEDYPYEEAATLWASIRDRHITLGLNDQGH